jgi:hypothetical protein
LQKIKVYAKQKVSTSTVDEDDWGWQASGLKQKDYCRVNQIAYHVFHYWYGYTGQTERTQVLFCR